MQNSLAAGTTTTALFRRHSTHFDFDKLDTYVGTIDQWAQRRLAQLVRFTCHSPLVVTYEELVADMPATTGRILPFLGLDVPVGYVTAPFARRLSDEVNPEWVRRYRAARFAEL